jgi:hypothetical protein
MEISIPTHGENMEWKEDIVFIMDPSRSKLLGH